MVVKIDSLEKVSFDTIFDTFSEAFIDYEIHVTKAELSAMLKRRGFCPELSFGAFHNEKLISFTLNGVGFYNDIKTAYDTGTGTVSSYRGKGLASSIFNYSLPYLRNAGVKQYLLEVLQHNTKAISVYKNLGFKVSREFNYFTKDVTSINIINTSLSPKYHIKEIDISQRDYFSSFWDFAPSWQNSFEAICRDLSKFKIYGAYNLDVIVGYCIFEPFSGDITQIAVSPQNRREGIASALLKEALKNNFHSSIKAINTESSSETIISFLDYLGMPIQGKQYEMIKLL